LRDLPLALKQGRRACLVQEARHALAAAAAAMPADIMGFSNRLLDHFTRHTSD
jgi:hypothetical protein